MSRKPAPASAQQRSRKTKLKRRRIATLTREEVRARSERYASKYTAKDFEDIADALGLLPARVKQEARCFEAVARWYFLDRRTPDRARPTDIHKQVLKIREAADRLLIHLGIDNPAEASDGPGDPEVFAALMTATDDGTEDDVARATAKIGRLVEISDAILAAVELRARAHQAAADCVDVRRFLVPKGRHGDQALNEWTIGILAIHRNLTAVDARLPLGRGEGTRLHRFLETAGRPLGLKQTRTEWKERIKTVLNPLAD